VKQRASVIIVGIACLVLGAAIQRVYDTLGARALQTAKVAPAAKTPDPVWTVAKVDRSRINYSGQPFWAWGVTEAPMDGEPQAVQGAPGAPANNANAGPSEEELNRKRTVTGSKLQFSLKEIRTVTNPNAGGQIVDWFPEDHGPIPDVVRFGPKAMGKNGRPCATCHLADGAGRPENASPAGLPEDYILRQLQDFKNDLRHSADPRKGNSNTMVMLAKGMSDDEMKESAGYFASVAWRTHVKVVETRLVPKTKIQGELFIPQSDKLTEPIGDRIVETPTNTEENNTLRSAHGTWTAYVPVGSIKKGEDLVVRGGMKVVNGQIVQGKTTACATCHGTDYMGIAPDVPPLAGRSPSYMAREIFDIQQGIRNGSNSNIALMRMVVDKLTPEDIINITAYLASLPLSPSGKPAPPTSAPITSQPNQAKPGGGPVASLQTR
jgi:cytochrome c553